MSNTNHTHTGRELELLLLDAKPQLACPNPDEWNAAKKDSVKGFINGIDTTASKMDEKERLRTLISGIPSPWARVTLTRKALTNPNTGDPNSVLNLCYRLFKSEWRGLMAAYVLRGDNFVFSEPIPLVGKNVEENMGEMSVLGSYGDMLFDDAPLWVHACEPLDKAKNPPKLQILYYKDARGNLIPVGATSPFTFLFCSLNYTLLAAEKDILWIDTEGKFIDPTSGDKVYLSHEELQRLHAFLMNVKAMIMPGDGVGHDASKYYLSWVLAMAEKSESIDYQDCLEFISEFQSALNTWAEQIAGMLQGETNINVPIHTARPEGPLALLLDSEKTFWFSDSKLYTEAQEGRVSIKSTEVFIDSDYIAAWKGIPDDPARDYAKSPVYYLGTQDRQYYLALPLTEKAQEIFRNSLRNMMKMNGNEDLRLEAVLGNGNQVAVKLYARLEQQERAILVCQRSYRLEVIPETSGKVFAWPNFKSDVWNKYYYYSEFPTNVLGIRMIPQFDGLDFLKDSPEVLKSHYLVKYPLNQVDASKHRYEIIRTEKPLKSVQVWITKQGKEVLGGTLLINKDSYATIGNDPRPATVGIDFGSSNTCAYYRFKSEAPVPVPFTNRRMALVGFDNAPLELAQKDELFFISNEGTLCPNGQIKSWIHEHDALYLDVSGDRGAGRLSQEIVGGVPVNESNIAVASMDEYSIKTNAGTLYYNMKWLAEDQSLKRKTSFMRMIWIQICADMLVANAYPEKLNWSFPSSMSTNGRTDLKKIYHDATLDSPFSLGKSGLERSDYSEAEADCAYAIEKGVGIEESELFIGIDVGGSTSDILILGPKDGKPKLFAQSSVRIAAGFFFDAIKGSRKFRETLVNFHNSRETGIRVMEIDSIKSNDPERFGRAPYFLNNVFDQLKTKRDFYKFYNAMHMDVAPVFALPAYVTGMLVFYCGMLARNVIQQNQFPTERVHLRYYGKGGRLFEWITDLYPDQSKPYYRRCFRAGLGEGFNVDLILDNSTDTTRSESKSEVAIGLVSSPDIITGGEIDEDGNRLIENCDIVGEKNLVYRRGGISRPVDMQEVIPDELFDGGINVEFPRPKDMDNLNRFLDIFISFVGEKTNIIRDTSHLRDLDQKINLSAFMLSDPEFQKSLRAARTDKKSPYRMPVIIAESLCYLNKVLLPEVSRQMN